jgi:Xaa-Pro aminopeptidase
VKSLPNRSDTLLIIGHSSSSADLYYATRFEVPTTVAYLEIAGRRVLLVSDLEYGRARTEACVDEVVSTSPYEEKLRAARQPAHIVAVLDQYLRPVGIRELTVPGSLTFAHAEQLRELGYELKLRHDPFFPERLVKTPEEIRAIAEVQAHTEEAMGLAAELLSRSEIRGDTLYLDGDVLTSERLRREIQRFLHERDCEAFDTIVAGGDQGADPHTRGHGPLPAHDTIIVDILPRSSRTKYFGDMSRTFVRGEASPAARKLYADVLGAQEVAFSMIRDGAEADKVHDAVATYLRDQGNPNEETNGRKTGFIHATGHGIGLEIHELPRIGRHKAVLVAGHVVTVEPGLYYPGKGSVRIEDAVVVTAQGHRNLNRFPKVLEL